MAQAGDGELAQHSRVGGQGRPRVVDDADPAGTAAGPGDGQWGPGAGRQGEQRSCAWVVTLESKISSAGSVPVTVRQWSAKASTSLFWVALDKSLLYVRSSGTRSARQ